MKLNRLLQDILPLTDPLEITGLSLDSRTVQAGDLFFALPGTQLDGRQYIHAAIAKGAAAIVTEGDTFKVTVEHNVPLIFMPQVRQYVSLIAARFFGEPAKKLQLIGITGTNGKTSCAHFIAAALQHMEIKTGVIGTLGNGLYGQIQPGHLTTPDAITLHKLFAELSAAGAKAIAMEVSSHAIDQERVKGIPFEVAVFTNLTREHLDYHGTMEAYGATKKRLFDNPDLRYAVINAEDALGQSMIQTLSNHKKIFAYGIKRPTQLSSTVPCVYTEDLHLTLAGIHATVVTPWGQGQIQVPLIGLFNLSNVLAVLTTLGVLNIPFDAVLTCLAALKPVPGRMQTFGGAGRPLVVVDYSHTPDALEKALLALRQHCAGKLFCVFGCGGNRDKGKRPLMAEIAEASADQVIVTDDNPRHENPAAIVADILQGFQNPTKIIVQHDRSKAIQDVIQYAGPRDCILIAGKGAETYQMIGDEKIPFSDAEKVNAFMAE